MLRNEKLILLFFLICLTISIIFSNAYPREVSVNEVTKICDEIKFPIQYKDCKLVNALIKIESNYNSEGYTSEKTGNYGLMQIQCGTAKWMAGLHKEIVQGFIPSIKDVFMSCNHLKNVKININIGMLYLDYLVKNQHLKDVKDIIAAYNAGKVYTCNAFKKWNTAVRVATYPLDKQIYVKKIIKNCKTYINDDYVNKVYEYYLES